ncbi:MAG: hypothetical protein LBV58_00320 [Acholeplasmatales bacterium]|jgi:hypothetical protein|nr:hypothetical protein [Acholeplasmatales bacterium]
MSKRGKGGYWFGSPWIISVIVSIIPGVNWVAGIIHRLVKGNILGVVVYIFLGWFLGFVDFVTILISNKIVLLA